MSSSDVKFSSILRLFVGVALFAAAPLWAREAPPDAAAQAKTLGLIKTLFKEDYAKTGRADRVALAKRLMEQAQATQDDATARYVLLDQAAELASGAGDIEMALRAVDLQAQNTEWDFLPGKIRLAQRARDGANTTAATEAVARACVKMLPEAVAGDRFDLGEKLAVMAESAAESTRQVALVQSVQSQTGDFRHVAGEFNDVVKAREALKAVPDDPAANLLIGRFYCLATGRWQAGLPFLAKGSDAALQALAAKEVANPAEGLLQTQLADAWWDYAGTLAPGERTVVRDHAAGWYRKASATISGFTLTRIQARIEESAARPAAATRPAPAAELDLLASIDPRRDGVAGDWRPYMGKWLSNNADHARLQLAGPVPQEYDLAVTFTRKTGTGPIAILLLGPGEEKLRKPFDYALDVQGHLARVETVGGKARDDNPTAAACTIDIGKSYAALVQVRKDRVKVLLNGKILCDYATDYKDLARYAPWKLKNEKSLGIGAHNSEVVFEKIELTAISK